MFCKREKDTKPTPVRWANRRNRCRSVGSRMGDNDWVLDYVMNLINSPAWEMPVMTFIDENCIIFDSDDENKFAYTDIHQQFKDMGMFVPPPILVTGQM